MTYFNGTSISSCGNIDFGSNNTVRVQFGITAEKNTSQVVGPSNIYVYTIGASGNRIERKAEIVQTVSFDTYYSTSADITMNSSDFNTSGGTLFAVFKSSGNVEYQSCSYAITKTQTPTFTLNPATLSFSCGDTSSKTFSMSNVYNSPGTLTYQWNIGSGWNVASSTSTSRTLTPTSSSPGNVSVTPILNGVAQPTQTCVVSLAAYNPLIAVIGSATGCPGTASNYSVNAGANAVTWSLSNPSLGTLSSTTGSSVSLTPTGSGSLTITATVTNACNQSKSFSKTITIGQPVLSNHTILGGNDNVSTNSYSILNITPATGATSYQWSVLPANDTGNCDTAGGLTPPGVIYPTVVDNGSYSKRINWGNCPGYYKVRCIATNSCAIQYYSDKRVTVFGAGGGGNPCGRAIAVTPNPIKGDGTITVNIIQPIVDPPCDNNKSTQVIIENIAVYDLKSNMVYSNKFKSNSITLNDLKLKKGLYIVQATTNDGTVISEKIIIE